MADRSAPKVLRLEEGAKLEILGSEHWIKLTGRDTGGAFMLMEQRYAPGAGVPPHVHAREDEAFRVLEGALRFRIGDESVTATAGTTLWAPREVVHGYEAVDRARLLTLVTPAGLEAMFEELARRPPGPLDPQELTGICARYGIRFV